MATSFRLRKAEPNERDCGAILGLICELADYEKCADEVEMTVERLIGDMKAGHFQGLLACCNDDEGEKEEETVGMALWFIQYFSDARKALYMEDLYVKPEYRRLGIGEALVRHLMDHEAKENKCSSVSWAVLNWNQLALDFYRKKLGAEVVPSCHLKRITIPLAK